MVINCTKIDKSNNHF